ncbi:MAG: hypothetical protein SX243_22700 [Acidobacteriota bacterium]|nr:hypothetical protein [Acidobacteriota bacterium]
MARNDRLETQEESLSEVRNVVRSALAGAGEVPELLIRAVAEGAGERSAVEAATRRIFGENKPLELVLFDTDRIGSYVFESSRPPVLKGASVILERLNQQIAGDHEDKVIFSGGGEGLLLVPAGQGKGLCEDIEKLFRKRTAEALSVTTLCLPVDPAEFVASESGPVSGGLKGVRLVAGTAAVLGRARDQVRRIKEQALPARKEIPGSAVRCESCRDREGTKPLPVKSRGDEQAPGGAEDGALVKGEALCSACALRWSKGRPEINGISLEELVETYALAQAKKAPPSTANGASPLPLEGKERYVGFLYADGNAMGQLFGGLESLAQLRFLSRAVAHVFGRVEGRVRELMVEEVGREVPFLSLLGGGDETVLILPAPLAVAVAERLPAWVGEASREVEGLQGVLEERGLQELTVGSGLVICEHKFPVKYQFGLAKTLQKNAKTLFYGAGSQTPPSALDFEVVTEGSPMGEALETARGVAYRTDDASFWRTCRPYTAERFSQLVHQVRSLAEQKMGKSQLYALQHGAAEGRLIFLNFLLYQVARNKKRYGRWLEAQNPPVLMAEPGAVQRFFLWSLHRGGGAAPETGTWIPDALQLAPFLGAEVGDLDPSREEG